MGYGPRDRRLSLLRMLREVGKVFGEVISGNADSSEKSVVEVKLQCSFFL